MSYDEAKAAFYDSEIECYLAKIGEIGRAIPEISECVAQTKFLLERREGKRVSKPGSEKAQFPAEPRRMAGHIRQHLTDPDFDLELTLKDWVEMYMVVSRLHEHVGRLDARTFKG